MKLWPFYSVSFETSFASNEALRRLHEEIGSDQIGVVVGPINAHVQSNTERRIFLGRSLPDGGEFRNNLNSDPGESRKYSPFQALIRTRIEPSALGSRVSALLRVNVFVIVLLLAWCLPFAWVTFAIASAMLRGEEHSPFLILPGPALILVAWLFACFAFSEDAETAERMLKVLLERD
ncbi:MAG: hypothetical protein JNL81_07990 [Hyphomonadaceae bacterium]|nr:hypothetical protein [Hyphomonadaceae bacterium]